MGRLRSVMVGELLERIGEDHRRIRRNCGLAVSVADEAVVSPGESASEAAACVLRFLECDGHEHVADEEDQLFPLLEARATGADAERFTRFLVAHAGGRGRLEALRVRVRDLLREVAAGRAADPALPQAARELAAAYERRIVLEEDEAWPIARRVLDESAAMRLGKTLGRRRVATFAAVAALAGAMSAVPAAADEKLAKDKGCTACHAVGKKLVGPDYVEVAKKYKGDSDAPAKLAASIAKGSAGKWGQIPMPPNKVSEDEARTLAAWVLAR
jgi:cytochrome c